MELFKIGFLSVGLIDIVDVALVSFIFYRLYIAMRGTIAAQIFVGLLLIMGVSFVAQAANLKVMTWIFQPLQVIWVIAFIILFQPELRRLLVLVGRNRIIRLFLKVDVHESIEDVVGAVTELSKKKHGAMIVFVRAIGIRTYAETGTKMEALVSNSLLLSIFHPRSPLHDGAVVIKDRLIEAARCTLPLSNLTVWEGRLLGTRHRAGLGISEQADVVVVIASEETGTISIAENGSLSQGLSPAALRQELRDRLNVETDRSVRSIWKTIRNNA
ncbi:MAG: diadenylate cyclase CdaA [Ignavibacteria bacterium]|nr:diadenylate cyclase CdaA [Ignavibacteria bacterium]